VLFNKFKPRCSNLDFISLYQFSSPADTFDSAFFHSVIDEDSVQVIDLMLDHPGGEVRIFSGLKIVLAENFPGTSDPLVSFDLGLDTWARETAFMAQSHLFVPGFPGRIDHYVPAVGIPYRDDPPLVTDLISGQAGASDFGFAVGLGRVDQVSDYFLDQVPGRVFQDLIAGDRELVGVGDDLFNHLPSFGVLDP
jgi:hypothetical protein